MTLDSRPGIISPGLFSPGFIGAEEQGDLEGTLAGVATVLGTLGIERRLAGTAATVAVVTGTLDAPLHDLAGEAAGSSAVSGSLPKILSRRIFGPTPTGEPRLFGTGAAAGTPRLFETPAEAVGTPRLIKQ